MTVKYFASKPSSLFFFRAPRPPVHAISTPGELYVKCEIRAARCQRRLLIA